MSYIGKNPKVKTLGLTPQSADPSNPQNGDMFLSDGTSRNAGVWIRKSGAWSRIGRMYTREMTVNGPFAALGAQDNVLFITLPDTLTAATLLEAKLTIFDAGASGNTEIDIRLKRGGAPATIFTTKPIVANSGGDYSTNSGTLSTTAFLGGDILILDIKTVPSTDAAGFNVELFFEE